MARMAVDVNGDAIPAVRVGTATNTTDTTYAAVSKGVARLTSSAGCTYGINVAASVVLPAGVVEYVSVFAGDVITIAGTCNISEAS